MEEARKSQLILLGLILVAALLFRISQVGSASFAGDGARELNVGRLIATGSHFPSQGVVMSFAQAHTGPAYYYLLALPNLLWKDPRCALIFIALYHTLAALILFRIARDYAGSAAGLVAAALFLASPLTAFEMNKIWGVNHMPLFVMLALWAVNQAFFHRRHRRLLIAAAAVGILVQLNIQGVIFVPFVIGMALIFRVKAPLRIWGGAFLVLVLSAAPFVAHEINNHFENLRAMVAFLHQTGGDTGALESAPDKVRAGFLRILPDRYWILTGRPKGSIFIAAGLGVVGLILAGQAKALLRLARSIRARKFETVADKQSLLFLAWFFLPVVFLMVFPGKIRPRYFLTGFPVGFIFAGAAVGAILSRVQAKGVRAGIAVFVGFLMLAQTALVLQRNRQADRDDRISLGSKIALVDAIIENLGAGENLTAGLYACSLPETEGRAIGLDYLFQTRKKGRDRQTAKPGIYLVYPSSSPAFGSVSKASFADSLHLLRFENMETLSAFLKTPEGRDHCPDFWNVHDHYQWELNREMPFDKILRHEEQGPPVYQ